MKRTPQQQKSIEVYCREIAAAMNDAGYDVQTAITLPVALTQEVVKEHIFKVIMRAMYPDKTSTTELSTTECQAVYETMNANLGTKFGVSLPWPSIESQEMEDRLKNG